MNAIRPDAVSFSVCFAFDEANEAVTNAIRMLAADENVSEALLYCPDGAFDKPVNLWRGGDKIALVSAPKKTAIGRKYNAAFRLHFLRRLRYEIVAHATILVYKYNMIGACRVRQLIVNDR